MNQASSPAAASATLSRQTGKNADTDSLAGELDEELAATYVYDPTEQEIAIDVSPTVVVEQGQQSYGESQKP
jgi:hypothetical protein